MKQELFPYEGKDIDTFPVYWPYFNAMIAVFVITLLSINKRYLKNLHTGIKQTEEATPDPKVAQFLANWRKGIEKLDLS